MTATIITGFSPCDYYLWEFLNGNIYGNNPRAVEEFNTEITAAVESITKEP
jgi:hypothetical protein